VLAILSVLTVLLGSSSALAAKRDLTIMPKVAPGSVPITGENWALLVGIDKYRDREIPALGTAVKDAEAVRDLLIERYGFKADRVRTLLNEQATRVAIEGALYRLGQQAGPNDSVFIYYAGHGQTDIEKVRGWWVPHDAKADDPATFIKNASVRDEIAAMKAKHVYLVADSCFSGTLFAQSRSMPLLNDKFFARLYQSKSRWGLTSGMNEPVADQGKGGHSIFAYFFLKVLRENEDPYLVPSHIYDQLAPLVGRNAEQQPRSEPLQGAGDEGGQFVFRLAGAVTAKAGTPREQEAPAAAPPSPSSSGTVTQDSKSDYLLAIGRGDLTKGPLVCERVADTVARAALAKQIRVYVEETFTHRQHERSGQPFEQDIEVVIKETASELLQEVQIIDRTMNKTANTCTSTAMMPKSRITQKAAATPIP